MSVCAACGTNNDESMKFCVNCGATLPSAPPPESWRQSGALGQQQAEPSGPASGYATPDPYAVPAPGWQQQGVTARPAVLYTIGEKRDPLMVVVFTLLTCGIYGIFWWYTVMTEIKNALGRQDINPGMEILLTFVTCGIYGFYLYYKYPQLMLEMQDRAGKPRNDITMTALLLAIFGLAIVSIPIMQSELNSIWDTAARK
jgi:hypothetical protein